MSMSAERDRANRESRRLRLLEDPTLAEHGRATTYNGWGCRCQSCRDAWSADSRARRAGVRKGPRKGRPIEERFWKKVVKSDGCWRWAGAPSAKGYGVIRRDDGTGTTAHRFSYELHNGPIPEGLQIDHMCYDRLCVNPDHLRAVTHTANMQNRLGAEYISQSGARGVYPDRDRWRVKVVVEGRVYSGGSFATVPEAEEVAIAMRRALMPDSLRDRQ